MRGLGTVILAAIVSGFIAGVVQIQLAVSFNAQEEFIVVMTGQVLLILIAAVLFWIVLLARGTEIAANRMALGLSAVIVVGLGGLEAPVLLQDGLQALSTDGPFLLEIVAPALLAILIMWWFVRRRIRKDAAATATA